MHKGHYFFRFILVTIFLVVLFTSSEKAGQTETARVAHEQSALSTTDRAPVFFPKYSSDEFDIATFTTEIASSEEITTRRQPLPDVVKGVYLTGFSAGSKRAMERIYSLIDSTEINAVIIDIKDASGRLSYQPLDESLRVTGVGTTRIPDIVSLIAKLKEKGIYVIGRIAVFQDPFYALAHPEDAFFDTRTGEIWKDYKGIAWLRPDSKAVWEYHIQIAQDAQRVGFDEINLDYVRFPSDGPLAYLNKEGQTQSREEIIESFFAYSGPKIQATGAVLSVDLFGLTLSASDDLGIGQKLELIAPYVDVVAPMIYPSHFADGAYGIPRPAEVPYEVIRIALSHGISKLEKVGISSTILRPWLQDFNLGALYTKEMVRAQIQATEELGLDSWMLWDPRNIYTQAALVIKE